MIKHTLRDIWGHVEKNPLILANTQFASNSDIWGMFSKSDVFYIVQLVCNLQCILDGGPCIALQ